MTIFTTPRLQRADMGVHEFGAGFGESLGATAGEAVSEMPTHQAFDIAELQEAKGEREDLTGMIGRVMGGEDLGDVATTPTQRRPEMLPMEARARVQEAGLDKTLTVPDGAMIRPEALDIMMDRARARQERASTMARGPQGFIPTATSVGTSFAVGALDPLNLAAAFIPVVGEMRYAKMLAGAGESALARAGVRAGVGAAEGAVGMATIEPFAAYAHTQEGRDYTMGDALRSIVFGAVLGSSLRTGGGAIADAMRGRQGRPLFPYDLGEPLEYHTPWDELRMEPAGAPGGGSRLPESFAETARRLEENARRPGTPAAAGEPPGRAAEGLAPGEPAAEGGGPAQPREAGPEAAGEAVVPTPPIEALSDLPPRAKEDVMRAATAAIVQGERVQVGEMVEAGAHSDPRISESVATGREAGIAHAANLSEPGRAVFADMRAQLQRAGMSEAEAEVNAAIVAARYEARAARLEGAAGTAEDLYRAENLSVRRGSLDDEFGRSYAQRGRGLPGQTDLFGGERISDAELAQRRANEPLRPDVAQRPMDEGLFGDTAAQSDLVDRSRAGRQYPLAPRSEWYGEANYETAGGRMVQMSPDEFLAQGRPLKVDETSRENIDDLKRHILDGKTLDPLKLYEGGKEDGRHRAIAAKELGIARVPVVTFRPVPRELFQSPATVPTFYSAVSRAVTSARQERASPEQWLATIRNTPGVKPEEIKWLGIEDWLKEQKGPVTRADVENYVRANSIEVREVEKGGQLTATADEQTALMGALEKMEREGNLGDPNAEVQGGAEDLMNGALRGDARAIGDLEALGIDDKLIAPFRDRGRPPTRFGTGQGAPLPGGENYRELLLTLPQTPAERSAGNVVADYARSLREKYGERYITEAPVAELRELNRLHDVAEAAPAQFTGSHWDEPNVLAHVRFDDRVIDGKKTLHVAEFQSDWHQKGRRQGYKEESKMPPELDAKARAIVEEKLDPFVRFATHSLRENGKIAIDRISFRDIDHWEGGDVITPAEASTLRNWTHSNQGFGHLAPLVEADDAARMARTKAVQDIWRKHTDGKATSMREAMDYGYGSETIRAADRDFSSDPEFLKLQERADHANMALNNARRSDAARVPDAPFKTTWPELTLKRMIRYAAENGYDRLSWDTGETNAARYDLSKQVKTLFLTRDVVNGNFHIEADTPTGHADIAHNVEPAKLEDYIGKDLAAKVAKDFEQPPPKTPTFTAEAVRNSNGGTDHHVYADGRKFAEYGFRTPEEAIRRAEQQWSEQNGVAKRRYSGLDLKVGGEGMKGFYDKILPATVNKLTKKFGGKVEESAVSTGDVKDFDLIEAGSGKWRVIDKRTGKYATDEAFRNGADAEKWLTENKLTDTSVHTLDITPELRKAATEEGFPLFQREEGGEMRGRITLADNKAIIDLFSAADRSTFMHETGHLWLDELARDADRAGAPEGVRRDMETVLKWLGAERADAITPEQHEKWARAFEQYLASGEAPSEGLRSAFEQFKAWLMALYRSLTALGEPVGPEIKGVMDRLLATDEQIAAKAAENAPAIVLKGPGGDRGPKARDPATWSLLEFLASRGGIRNDDPLVADLRSSIGRDNKFVPGFGNLLRAPRLLSTAEQRGGRRAAMTLDQAREAAVEAGYLRDAGDTTGGTAKTTINDLLEAVDRELRGDKVYREGHEAATKAEKPIDPGEEIHYINGEIDHALRETGTKPEHLDGKLRDRVIEIMQKEGERDPLVAYERAIMEETHYGAEEGKHERIQDHIPGWDVPREQVPGEPGATPAAGRPVEGVGRPGEPQAGRSPRTAGGADRGAPTPDQSWRALADSPRDFNEPDVVAASKAAEALPEPASLRPDKRLAAAQKAEQDSAEMFAQNEAYLPADLRDRVAQELRVLEQDGVDTTEVIRRGAACLAAGAIGAA